ncbi:D-TA family PLP-dependent enzyme [Pontibacter sp. G13]|uniref:D-TA family PLP-dependent enzyme n=1 Tax=Pontibacter sp. G13 TaxID=3074898 RepID=UPI002889A716|nr:D-TA family PLP-dependent enzyme [Pontibacter sp. G13]WNJ20654.1 D-TA family PLP-dependent enzyme [Pontibacter sp. G13]
MDWYQLTHPETLDTPNLLVFPDRVNHNIRTAIKTAGDVARLRPHVKTHKTSEIAQMHLQHGIYRFKCATIAEAEMLAQAGAQEVLLAHQPVGPRIRRLVELAQAYPKVQFGTLLDDTHVLELLNEAAAHGQVMLDIWIDLDTGMGRSGIQASEEALDLYQRIHKASQLNPRGIHAYDGHIRDREFEVRKQQSDLAFEQVQSFKTALEAANLPIDSIVAGGSPTFPVHALRNGVELSPGTYPLWDAGYSMIVPEVDFQPALVVATRIISKPGTDLITLDLGHKAIASENPLDKRIHFLHKEPYTVVKHSEEHLVVKVEDQDKWQVGDLWYGIPHHVCPTVNLHEAMEVVVEGAIRDQWEIVARSRRIRI